MATQFTTWGADGADWLDPSDVAWASLGMWWDDTLNGPIAAADIYFSVVYCVDNRHSVLVVDDRDKQFAIDDRDVDLLYD